MNILWGILMLIIGGFFFFGAYKKTDFLLYRIFYERSRILWKEHTHYFYMIVGLILMMLSLLFFFGVWS